MHILLFNKMKRLIKKLVLTENPKSLSSSNGIITKRIQNIRGIWNNEHHDDVGIEKLFRLVLATSQFIFPGLYVKHFFSKQGSDFQDLAMDFYILGKVVLPVTLLYFSNWIPYPISIYIIIWFLLETLLYIPTLIFASDFFSRPSSYRRSMLMLFFNYLEIAFAYAYIYSCGNYLNQAFEHWYDPIYFSMVILSTIGLGEYYPITGIGKLLVCSQSVIFLMFVVLFINFFSNKVESRGYFDHSNKD